MKMQRVNEMLSVLFIISILGFASNIGARPILPRNDVPPGAGSNDVPPGAGGNDVPPGAGGAPAFSWPPGQIIPGLTVPPGLGSIWGRLVCTFFPLDERCNKLISPGLDEELLPPIPTKPIGEVPGQSGSASAPSPGSFVDLPVRPFRERGSPQFATQDTSIYCIFHPKAPECKDGGESDG